MSPKSLLGGSAAAALLSASLLFYAGSDYAQTLAQSAPKSSNSQATVSPYLASASGIESNSIDAGASVSAPAVSPGIITRARRAPTKAGHNPEEVSNGVSVAPPQSFVATAYSLRGRTASGRGVARGLIAADRRVLPLGTRVRLDAGSYSGEYLVADTGGAIRGRRIDIWMPHGSEAMRFGRRSVKLTVLTQQRNSPRVRR